MRFYTNYGEIARGGGQEREKGRKKSKEMGGGGGKEKKEGISREGARKKREMRVSELERKSKSEGKMNLVTYGMLIRMLFCSSWTIRGVCVVIAIYRATLWPF